MAVLGVTDVELGRRLGVSRQAAHARRTGRTAMTAADMIELAEALDIDPALFLGQPSDALRWLVEHRSEVLDALEPAAGRQGELSKRSGRQGCTATTLTYLLYRDIVSAERTDLAA